MSGTVLVVDDQLQPRRLLIDELEQAGFIVTAASDGEEAWQSFCQHAPDVACGTDRPTVVVGQQLLPLPRSLLATGCCPFPSPPKLPF